MREYGVESYFEFIGNLSRDALAEQYLASDVVIVPSFIETICQPYLEAMSFGLPILASNTEFSRAVCGNYAKYFELQSPASLFDLVRDFSYSLKGSSDAVTSPAFVSASWQAFVEMLLSPPEAAVLVDRGSEVS